MLVNLIVCDLMPIPKRSSITGNKFCRRNDCSSTWTICWRNHRAANGVECSLYLSVPVNATVIVLLDIYLDFEYNKRISFPETPSFILVTACDGHCYHE